MSFCNSCNHSVLDEDRYCGQCGSPIEINYVRFPFLRNDSEILLKQLIVIGAFSLTYTVLYFYLNITENFEVYETDYFTYFSLTTKTISLLISIFFILESKTRLAKIVLACFVFVELSSFFFQHILKLFDGSL